MDNYYLIGLIILSVPLEAFHDWHRQTWVNAGATYSNGADRVSKRIKFMMLGILWYGGLVFNLTFPYIILHIGLRTLFFDYFYEVYRNWGTYGWKIFIWGFKIAWDNRECKKQWLSLKKMLG